MSSRPQQSQSPWMERAERPRPAPLDRDTHADVCVIGAGIAGLSVARELLLEGRSVVVIDRNGIGGGESSRTTAHLTCVLDERYHALERLHGEGGARLAAESHATAIDHIERIVGAEHIDCAFERVDGYLFAPPGESRETLEKEIEICQREGLVEVSWAERAPIAAIHTGPCLRFRRQAQFDPVRYLEALADIIEREGGHIYANTHATKIEGGKDGRSGRVQIGEDGPVITAGDLVVATEVPVNDLVTMHTKQYPYRTYAIAGNIPRGSLSPALYWDTAKPYHYVRMQHDGVEDLLIVGGEDDKTGHHNDGEDRYRALELWARERFPMMERVCYRWSGQITEPMDKLAFIGLNPGDENVWIVTGTSGNGMTYGVLAGLLLRDLILDRENPWAKLYDPSRKSLRAALEFAQENLDMVAQYAAWVTRGDVKDESEILPGTGAIVRHGTRKVAAYRDRDGELHRCSAVCSHLGAIVRWNSEECSWDCPAHGSRFDADGNVINGPAVAPLGRLEDEAAAKRPQEADVREAR